MEESPGESSDVVEELDGSFGLSIVDGAGTEEELEMGVDLFGRRVGDAEVVDAIST